MRKIVIITKSMFAGGAERVIAQLANYFVCKNIDCTIITTDKDQILYNLSEQIHTYEIGLKNSNKLIDRIMRYSLIRQIVKKINPDVVLTMPEDTGIYVILGLLGTSIPVVVSERNNPWVMPDKKITRFLRRIMYPFAAGIIFQTKMAQSFFPKYLQKKSVILDNPVDESRIPRKYCGERRKVFVSAGRLDEQKNFAILIKAFSEFIKIRSDYELLIYGEGNLRADLEKLITYNNMDGLIKLPGRNNNLLDEIKDCAAFILSSNYEGMPNVLLEAMCMGMPVISTDCPSGGPKSLINDNFNGILVPVNNVERLLDAMLRITDDKLAKRLGDNAYLLRKQKTSKDIFASWEDYLFSR